MAAAARLGAFGVFGASHGQSSSHVLYSSIPLESFHQRDSRERRRETAETESASGTDGHLRRARSRRSHSTSFRQTGNKGYGIALSNAETAHNRFQARQRLIDKRVKLCNWSVYVALAGLVIAIIDVEIQVGGYGNISQSFHLSTALRLIVLTLTIFLDALIVGHHVTEDKILSVDTGQTATYLSRATKVKMLTELIICSCCPLPGSHSFNWPNLGLIGTALQLRVIVPLNVIMTIPMFLRLYLIGRWLVLHSAIQDSSTRAIASFNHVLVDLPFVLKTMLCERPLTLIAISGGVFWTSMTWVVTQCERYATDNAMSNAYYFFDYAWFEAVTFFAIGFGDIEMVTYCGRTAAILTGLVGTITSSLITVLVSQRMLLSLAERRVNQVVAESHLTNLHRNEAARVLQWTWRVVRLRKRFEGSICGKGASSALFHLRISQRHLLAAILDFRRCRWKLRIRRDEEDDYITVKKAFAETEDRLRHIRNRQKQLGIHLANLSRIIDALSCVFVQKYGLKQTTVQIGQLTREVSVTTIASADTDADQS